VKEKKNERDKSERDKSEREKSETEKKKAKETKVREKKVKETKVKELKGRDRNLPPQKRCQISHYYYFLICPISKSESKLEGCNIFLFFRIQSETK